MRKSIILILWISLIQLSRGDGNWYERWSNAGATWEERWINLAGKSESMAPSERIELFGHALGVASNPVMKDEVKHIYLRIQRILLATPGHAEYYWDRILAARLEYEAAKAGSNTDKSSWLRSELSHVQANGFRTMAYLPSVETVRVLGEFLADERGYTKVPPNPTIDDLEATGLEQPNCKGAAKAFVSLPIVSKPLVKNWTSVSFDDVPLWRTWYEQIKAGKRTFRFEGDSTEYDLSGPASNEKLARIERDRMRDAERLAGRRKSSPDSDFVFQALNLSKPSSIAGLIAACAFLAGAVWYFMKHRRVA